MPYPFWIDILSFAGEYIVAEVSQLADTGCDERSSAAAARKLGGILQGCAELATHPKARAAMAISHIWNFPASIGGATALAVT
jgi:hypothetical protein